MPPPGQLRATQYDPETGTLRASGTGPRRAGPMVAFHPGPTAEDVDVAVTGLAEPEIDELPGGGLLITADPEGGRWKLRIEPRSGA